MRTEIMDLMKIDNIPDDALRVFCEVIGGPVYPGLLIGILDLLSIWISMYLDFFFINRLIFTANVPVRNFPSMEKYVLWPGNTSTTIMIDDLGGVLKWN